MLLLLPERAQSGHDEFEEESSDGWMGGQSDFRYARTPPEGQFPQQNAGIVKFEAPKVPVVFVLGMYVRM